MCALLHDASSRRRLAWSVDCETLFIDGNPLVARACFLRYDVFGPPNASGLDIGMGWYTTLLAWALAQPEIGLFNRCLDPHASIKPYGLRAALRAGLLVPPTLIANDVAAIRDHAGEAIVKPVAGGSYTRRLGSLLDRSDSAAPLPMPAIVQKKLSYPEYRIFFVAGMFHIFEIHSQYIDYRPDQSNSMRYLGPGFDFPDILAALRCLFDSLGCDYCACDFKVDSATGVPHFLELNSGAMFTAYDQCADGSLCDSMITALLR